MQRFIEESYGSGDYECFRMEDEVSTALNIAPKEGENVDKETYLPSFIPQGFRPGAPRPSNDKMVKSIPKDAIDYLLPISITAEKFNCLKANCHNTLQFAFKALGVHLYMKGMF